jgi:hypothetical protein
VQSFKAISAKNGFIISLLFATTATSPRNQQALLHTKGDYYSVWVRISIAISMSYGSYSLKASLN